ncbi:MAG: glycosyltransferase family 4 protein [Vicingaceae bacterium]
MHDSIKFKELKKGVNGGNLYDYHAVLSLSEEHEVVADEKAVWQHDNPISYALRLRRKPKAEVSVSEPYPIVFGNLSNSKYNVGIIHHIDFERKNNSLKHRWFFNRLLKRVKKLDCLVVVSNYWKKYFEEAGCSKVKTIYNSFDPELYLFNEEEKSTLRKSLGFATDQPLVYIGNATKEKGVYEVYEALKGIKGIQMVMTGRANQAKELPVKFLSLSEEKYRLLLASCDVVVAFSKMMEGWNRIAHEAMLCKVPVVGSGIGGMRELLEGGQQLIAQEESKLKGQVEKAFQEKTTLGELGYHYASQFNHDYFRKSWLDLIANLQEH